MNKRKSVIITIVIYSFALLIGLLLYIFLFQDMDLLWSALVIDIIITTVIFGFSFLFNNSSLYDPYWSILPIFIVLLWIIGLSSYHILSYLLFTGVLIWGVRLTLNWYWNFTGYQKEDFRYMDFRKRFKHFYWPISYFGIHMFPTLIVFISLYPIYYSLTNTIESPLYIVLGVFIMIGSTYISFIADNQLRFHKQSSQKQSINYGLWKYSRHPNYFGEVCFWFGVYVTSISVDITFYPVVGFIGMLLLFNFYSVPKMEQRLLHNKSDYQNIVNNVPRFFIRKRKAD